MATSMYANQDSGPSKKPSSVYVAPDPTQRVIYAKRSVQTRADTEDGGQHIYESVDIRSYEEVPEPQEDAAGRQGQSSWTTVRKTLIAVAVCLGMLLLVFIGLVVHYKSAYGQSHINHHILQTNYENLTLERSNLLTKYDNLTKDLDIITAEKDQIQSSYDQLQSRYDALTNQKDQTTNYDLLTTERDELKRRLCDLSEWQLFGSSCYYISTERKTWADSRQWCRDNQADLIIINSQEEQDFVKRVNRNQGVWLGLTDSEEEGVWKWIDGKPLTSPTYWEPGEPNDYGGGQDCAEHWSGLGWYDDPCTRTLSWMCEKVVQ